MHKKQYPIAIWFLSNNLSESAQWLDDKSLNHTIRGCVTALISTRLYYNGIRSVKFYRYYFSKENYSETMERFFPLWPLSVQPTIIGYKSGFSKWTRKCKEHYDYIKTYLDILLNEYEYRFKKVNKNEVFLEWNEVDAPQLNIPAANLTKIVVPWKVLNPKYRRKDIESGYRLQYKAYVENFSLTVDSYTLRPIPEFLLQKNSEWMN